MLNNRTGKTYFAYGIAIIIGTVILFGVFRQVICSVYSFKRIDKILESGTTRVLLNGNEVCNLDRIKQAFHNRDYTKISGSHPAEHHSLLMSDGSDKILLTLAVDSKDVEKYWLYIADTDEKFNIGFIQISLPEVVSRDRCKT